MAIDSIEQLMRHVHPDVERVVQLNLIQTFARQLATHRNEQRELEELNDFAEREVTTGPMWATW